MYLSLIPAAEFASLDEVRYSQRSNISNIAKNFFLTSLFLAFHHLFVTLLPYLDVKLV